MQSLLQLHKVLGPSESHTSGCYGIIFICVILDPTLLGAVQIQNEKMVPVPLVALCVGICGAGVEIPPSEQDELQKSLVQHPAAGSK